MIETFSNFEEQLNKLEAIIQTQTTDKQVMQTLQKVYFLLPNVNMAEIKNFKHFVENCIAKILKKATQVSLNEDPEAKEKIQSLILRIVQIYAKGIRLRCEVYGFEAIFQLLFKQDAQVFQNSQMMIESEQFSNDKEQMLESEYQWIVIKKSHLKTHTIFYYKCFNTFCEIIKGIQSVFKVAGFTFIKEYINFIRIYSHQFKKNKLKQLMQEILTSLEDLMVSVANNKQSHKQSIIQNIHSVSAAGAKLAQQLKQVEHRERFEMLTSTYGLSLLGLSSIEKKCNGLKILNKQAEEFHRSPHYCVKEKDYVAWLLNSKIFEFIFQGASETPSIVENSDYLFRIVFKKRCIQIQNFEKFLDFIEKTSQYNRQLVLKYLKYETIRQQYDEYDCFLARLKIDREADFYEEQHFQIATQFMRYATPKLITQYSLAISKILKLHHDNFRNDKILYRCIRSYVKSIQHLADKQVFFDKKAVAFLDTYDQYFGKEFTKLGIMIFRVIFEELPEGTQFSKAKCANLLINKKNVISQGLKFMKNSQITQILQKEIENFLVLLLNNAQECYEQINLQLDDQILLNALDSRQISSKLMNHVNTKQIQKIYEQVLNRVNLQLIQFEAIKCVFCKLNQENVSMVEIHKGVYSCEVKCKTDDLIGIDSLKYLMLNSSSPMTRHEVADFLSDLYVCYVEQRTQEGEKELYAKMVQTLQLTLKEFQTKESESRMLGYLAFIQKLMMATQILGVGTFKPHNSLVPTSTVQVRIENNITFGDDVSQTYDKKVPGNLTLFQLLTEVGEKFRCSACQISLYQGIYFLSEKCNGLTLEELGIDGKIFRASKSLKDKIRLETLMVDGELTPKAIKVFEEIYNTFAVDGKMGKVECSNFVAGVTKTSSSPYDNRVIEFLKDYDSDQDDNITLEDFLKFYKYNIVHGRDDVVWKNLNNMRFRKDLKKYDDPIQLANQNMRFRAILSRSDEFYNVLFQLSESPSKQLKFRGKQILLRLPTFHKTVDSVHSELDLNSKNTFQIQYLLIAIQSKLSTGGDLSQEKKKNQQLFIQSGNILQIFKMMMRIHQMDAVLVTVDEKKCVIIALQIIRSLLKIPNLRSVIKIEDKFEINLKLPQTTLFQSVATTSLKNIEIEILQASFAMQFTQQQNLLELALEGIFHDELGIAQICCNYVFILYMIKKVNKDLFEIEQKRNCQFWFDTLTKICTIDKSIDFWKIIRKSLNILKTREQSIERNPDDPIIFGHLNIIYTILKETKQEFENFSAQIVQISSKIISVRSRSLIYQILAHFNIEYAVSFVIELINSVEPIQQIEVKNCYVGLRNLGNTCYMNSVLQALFYVDEFKSFILSLPREQIMATQINGKNIYDNTLYQLQKMYTYFEKSTKKFYNPEDFCLTIKNISTGQPIDPRVQEDAHEFVSKILDKFEKLALKANQLQRFRQLFEGTTITQILCKECNNKILRQQSFLHLSLSVQNFFRIQQSFNKYILPQEIEDYFCQRCNKRVEKIQKSTYLSKLPKLLIINLQRIIYDLEDFIFKKVDTTFQFPQELSIYDYVIKQSNTNLEKKDCQYNLKGIIIHSGSSQSGHYYSILKIGSEWFKFNDKSVTKFDVKELPHEAYGGYESKQQWGDQLKFSTNAYILLYEKKDSNEKDYELKLQEDFIQEINEDNKKFYKQLQVHQQSIYIFANELFEKFQPADIEEKMKVRAYEENWNEDPNLPQYEILYELHLRLLKFSTVFYRLKQNINFKIGQNIFRLFYLLPEKSYTFLTETKPEEIYENLCLHNDEVIRSIYKYLLNKSMHVFNGYYMINFQSEEPGIISIMKILDSLLEFFNDQFIFKNISKSEHFLDFWKISCEYVPPILDYVIKKDLLTTLADKLLGNQSPYAKPLEKKRPQFTQMNAISMLQTITYLMSRKKNMKGYINPMRVFEGITYYEMTQSQKNIYGRVKFYEKMIANKWDGGILGSITSRLAEQDENFSQKLAQFFLKNLNNPKDTESSIVLLNHLRSYLSIMDDFTEKRLKWIIGIPQLKQMDYELVYGFSIDLHSAIYQYLSPLHFSEHSKQNHKTVLTILYDSQMQYNNNFISSAVLLFLDLMLQSDHTFKYIMKLPPPNYLMVSHLDWFYKFINKFKENGPEDNRPDREMMLNKYVEIYGVLMQKVKQEELDLPTNKKIIGKNKDLTALQSVYNEKYTITLWCHSTYVLPNMPTGDSNKSLPQELFRFLPSTGSNNLPRYFLSKFSMSQFAEQSQQIPSEFSIITFEVQARQRLKIKFKFQAFTQQIHLEKGKTFINFPYQQINQSLAQFIQVTEKQDSSEEQEKREQKMEEEPEEQDGKGERGRRNQDNIREIIEGKGNHTKTKDTPLNSMNTGSDMEGEEQHNDMINWNYIIDHHSKKKVCQICTLANDASSYECEACGNELQ